MPYETWLEDGTSVVQVIVVEVSVVPETETPVITGGGPAEIVEKLPFGEVDDGPALAAEIAAKLYVVPGLRLDKVTEWLKVSELFSVEVDP